MQYDFSKPKVKPKPFLKSFLKDLIRQARVEIALKMLVTVQTQNRPKYPKMHNHSDILFYKCTVTSTENETVIIITIILNSTANEILYIRNMKKYKLPQTLAKYNFLIFFSTTIIREHNCTS